MNNLLLIPGPQPGERLGSIIDRACATYEISREAVFVGTRDVSTLKVRDWDDVGDELVDALAAALVCSSSEVAATAIQDGQGWLNPMARQVYCPHCFHGDVMQGRQSYLRKEWSRVFATICRAHLKPLVQLPLLASGAAWLQPDPAWDRSSFNHKPMADDGFTQHLVDWESDLDTRPPNDLAVLLVSLVGVNHGLESQQPYAGSLERDRRGGWTHSRGYCRRQDPLEPGYDAWERFRAIQDPARRRSAIYWAAVSMGLDWAIQVLPSLASLGSTIRTREEWWHWELRAALPEAATRRVSEFESVLGIGRPQGARK